MTSSVLIVDDEQIWARNLERYLGRRGFDAASTHSVRRAEAMALRDRPSLLCLDLRLPDGDGLELLGRLRGRGMRTPCLLMTAHASKTTYEEATRLDAAVIEKPAGLAEIRKRISKMLEDVRIAADRVSEQQRAQGGGEARKMVVMYSHDGFGLGHMRRNLNLARALTADPSINVLMLIGCPNGLFFDLPPGIDFIKLPSIIKVDTEAWETRKLGLGVETTCALRAGLILHTLKTLRPDMFLVDFVPQGVGKELLPALDWIREQPDPPETILGLRDILDQPERLAQNWQEHGAYEVIERYYHRVLIYGHRHVFDSADAYGFNERLGRRVTHCGYLAPGELGSVLRPYAWRHGRAKRLVTTAGGGRDGFELMTGTLEAMRLLPPDLCPEAVLVTGPLMEQDYREKLATEAEGLPVEIVYWTEDSRSLIRDADVVICMAGYNTLAETIGLGKRPIVLPRAGPSAEQRLRTRLFADLDLIEPLWPEEMSPDRLARLLQRELRRPTQLPEGLVPTLYDGLPRASALLTDLLARRKASGAEAVLQIADVRP